MGPVRREREGYGYGDRLTDGRKDRQTDIQTNRDKHRDRERARVPHSDQTESVLFADQCC